MPPGAADKTGIGDRHDQIRAANKHSHTISTRLCRCLRRVLGHGRLHTGDSLGLFTVALGTQLSPLQRIAGPGGLIAVDDVAIDLAPGVAAPSHFPIFFEHPVGVADILLRGREPAILRLDHRRVESTTVAKAALAGCLCLAESQVWITHTASGIRHKGRGPRLNLQRTGNELALSFTIHKLVEANEHLHTQITRHVVTGRPAKILHARTGRDDLIAIRHANRRLDVGTDLDGTRTNAALTLQTCDDLVKLADLGTVFGLGIVDPAQAWPDDGFQVSQDVVVIDARTD